ncbi:MAG: hypothetical protein MSIBF_07100 [Candidatus Altiarchaeales archaeon IMC4]|nr:MAG: hypothetical protein MSIBF_07100 [Candidatus Altiarchaeales archaeon IMC4]
MIKSRFKLDGASVRIGMLFSRINVTPTAWTFFTLTPAVAGFVCLSKGDLLTGAIMFILAGFFDAVDGAVARVTGRTSAMGAFLDGVIDRYVEILLYFGLLFYGIQDLLLPSYFWLSLLIVGALMPTYVRAYADHRGVVTEPEDLVTMGGLIERPERLGLLFIGMLAGGVYLVYAVAAVAILSNLTAVQRILFVVNYKK